MTQTSKGPERVMVPTITGLEVDFAGIDMPNGFIRIQAVGTVWSGGYSDPRLEPIQDTHNPQLLLLRMTAAPPANGQMVAQAVTRIVATLEVPMTGQDVPSAIRVASMQNSADVQIPDRR